jgi:hypothetical protein
MMGGRVGRVVGSGCGTLDVTSVYKDIRYLRLRTEDIYQMQLHR